MFTPKFKISRILIALALFAILILNSKNITSPLRIKIVDALSPLLKTAHALSSFTKGIIPFASFREENRILRERVSMLTRKLEEANVVYGENDRLKDMLTFRKTVPYTTVPAQVIGRDPTNWSNSIIINKGLNDGISRNKAVISAKGLVGRIVETGRYSSKIQLITDPNSKVGVLIQRNRQGGILVGRPDGKCKMIYIALDSDVKAQDKVISAGYGAVYPKDILVGEITTVDRQPGRLYKYAIIETSQDMSRLEEVLCIK